MPLSSQYPVYDERYESESQATSNSRHVYLADWHEIVSTLLVLVPKLSDKPLDSFYCFTTLLYPHCAHCHNSANACSATISSGLPHRGHCHVLPCGSSIIFLSSSLALSAFIFPPTHLILLPLCGGWACSGCARSRLQTAARCPLPLPRRDISLAHLPAFFVLQRR